MKGTRAPQELRAKLIIGDESLDAETLVGTTLSFNEHILTTKVRAHAIANIDGLRAELDGKLDGSAVTRTLDVITDVDFDNNIVSKTRITFTNGIVTSIADI